MANAVVATAPPPSCFAREPDPVAAFEVAVTAFTNSVGAAGPAVAAAAAAAAAATAPVAGGSSTQHYGKKLLMSDADFARFQAEAAAVVAAQHEQQQQQQQQAAAGTVWTDENGNLFLVPHATYDPTSGGGVRACPTLWQPQHEAEADAALKFGGAPAPAAASSSSSSSSSASNTSRADTPTPASTRLLGVALLDGVFLDVVTSYNSAGDLCRLCTASKRWHKLINGRATQWFGAPAPSSANTNAAKKAATAKADDGPTFGFGVSTSYLAPTESGTGFVSADGIIPFHVVNPPPPAHAVAQLQEQFHFAVEHPFAVTGVQYATNPYDFQDTLQSAARQFAAPPPPRPVYVGPQLPVGVVSMSTEPAALPAPADGDTTGAAQASSTSSGAAPAAAAASGSSYGAATAAAAGAGAGASASLSSSSTPNPVPAAVRVRRAPSAAEEISVAILDAGAQYGKVIDRRVRELCVHSDILPLNTSVELLKRYGAIIVSGGPQSVYAPDAPRCDPNLLKIGKPVFGICYGLQLINFMSGGSVSKHAVREDGQFRVDVDTAAPLFTDLPKQINVLLTHGDSVSQVAADYKQIGTSNSSGLVAAIQHKHLPIAAVQFHPEVDLTEHGLAIIRNFLFHIAKLPALYTPKSRQEAAISHIRDVVGADSTSDSKVLMLISGGVDSTVCAALLKAAVGADRIRAIHINNGFMRAHESDGVAKALASVGLSIKVVDASAQFYAATTSIQGKNTARLDECCVPEWKRKIIGDTFVHVAQQAMSDFGLQPSEVYLAQGTLRPDLIESASDMASSQAEVIKTHHNDTELVRALRKARRVLEPLKDYHKDEVRALGLELGLPKELVWRQPFPGPGLAVRILCGAAPQLPDAGLDAVQKALSPYDNERIDARVLPVRTVGVQGDSRSYSSLVALTCKHAYKAASAAIGVVPTPAAGAGAAALPAAVAAAAAGAGAAAAGASADAKDSKTPAVGAAAAACGVAPSSSPSSSPLSGIPWAELFETALAIPKRVHGVNRVVFVFGAPLSCSAEAKAATSQGYTPTYLKPEPIAQLQAADAIVNAVLLKYQLTKCLSQVPVILFPANFGEAGKRSITIRTFITNDFMTGLPAVPGSAAMPFEALQEMVDGVLSRVPGIARVCYDLTAKPPATTEWE